jgi:hypothetical protein
MCMFIKTIKHRSRIPLCYWINNTRNRAKQKAPGKRKHDPSPIFMGINFVWFLPGKRKHDPSPIFMGINFVLPHSISVLCFSSHQSRNGSEWKYVRILPLTCHCRNGNENYFNWVLANHARQIHKVHFL